jgi:hypothetical protein
MKNKQLNSQELNAIVNVIWNTLSLSFKQKQDKQKEAEDQFIKDSIKGNALLTKLYKNSPSHIRTAFQGSFPNVFKKHQYLSINSSKIKDQLIIQNLSSDGFNVEEVINQIVKDYENGKF